MTALASLLRYFARAWWLNVRAFAQYPYDFAVGTAYTLLYQLVGVGTIYVLLSRFHRLGGWPLPALLFLFALRLLSHGVYLLLFRPVKQVPTHIRQGTFDRFLLRPKPPLLQALAIPDPQPGHDLVVGILFFGLTAAMVHLRWTAPHVAVLLLTIVGGALIAFAVELLVAATGFWLVDTGELSWLAMVLEERYIVYPANIFAKPLQAAMTFILPFAFMNFYPAAWLLHETTRGAFLPAAAGLFVLPVGLTCAGLAWLVWLRAVAQYQGAGS